ncbi:MAG: toxin-antitoxin system HicB family antitoxin [Negativicutes bacterium]|nr:toxin-antitoxin system HicB family antitoxin [Negativicutes bacterium]
MFRKQTITFPADLHEKLSREAAACGFSLNKYVIKRLRAKENVVFLSLQELTQALMELRIMLLDSKQSYEDSVKQEVLRICQFCEYLLVQTIKNSD